MRYVTRVELSRIAKVAHQVVYRSCKKGGKFHEAMSSSGKVDIDHPVIAEWLETREVVIAADDLTSQEFEDMTVKEICSHYGNVDKLEGYIKTRKMIVETEHKKIQMEASREQLVSREFLGKACFGYLQEANIKLLAMPRGIVERISAILETQALGIKEEAEQVIVVEISKILKNAKKELMDRLKIENPS